VTGKRWSLASSFVVHAAILLAAVVTLPAAEGYKVALPPPIPVDIVSVEDFSKRMATSKDAPETPADQPAAPPKIEPKADPKPAKKVAEKQETAAKEPPKQAEPEPDLKDLIKKSEDVEPTPEKPAEKKAEAPPKPKTKPKPPEKKKEQKLDVDEVAALLNKVDEEQAAPAEQTEVTGTPRRAAFNSQGTDQAQAATMLEALRARISQCWSVPAGVRDGDQLLIRLQIQFNPDGSLSSEPALLNTSGHPAFGAAVRSATSAIVGCAPYGDILPADKYDQWRSIIVNFDPSQMLATN
jgi:outer membrane biosynthesis protein TonB